MAKFKVTFKVDQLGSTRVTVSVAADEYTAVARGAMQLREYHPDWVAVLKVENCG